MVLVYDLRRDSQRRNRFLSGLEKQWQAYLRGKVPTSVVMGRITELFYAPYEGEHMFRIDEGKTTSAWERLGDHSWYAVGRLAKIEKATFQVAYPIGDMPITTRIWIGDVKSKSLRSPIARKNG